MNTISFIVLFAFVSFAYGIDGGNHGSGKSNCLNFIYIKKMINFIKSKQEL